VASIKDLALQMGIKTDSGNENQKARNTVKRRPWLEDEDENTSTIKKGDLTIPVSKLESADKKLKLIQEKTDKIIERVEKRNNRKLVDNEQVINNKLTPNEHFRLFASRKKTASFFEYQCLKGLPKLIMAEIKKNVVYDQSKDVYTSFLDTEILKQSSGKSANHIAVQIGRMIEQGFFEVVYSTKSGSRIVKIDPEIIGIKTTIN
jgi:hypothetical protein